MRPIKEQDWVWVLFGMAVAVSMFGAAFIIGLIMDSASAVHSYLNN